MSETKNAIESGQHEKVKLLANPDVLIDWFDDLGSGNEEFRFLSNFYEGAPLVVPGMSAFGVEFVTGEHMFAAFKATSAADFMAIATAQAQEINYGTTKKPKLKMESAPGVAKAMGRSIKLRPDWDDVRLDVMALVLRTKFTLHREEGKRLFATGSAYLQEGTWWNDRVWGVDLSSPGRPGRNWLGTLLMARRAELRVQKDTGFMHDTGWHNLTYAGVGW